MVVRKGATLEKKILVKNQADLSAFDFTGWEAEMHVYTSPADRHPNLVFGDTEGLTLSNGEIELKKSAAIMERFRRHDLIYFLWLTDPEGKKSLWLNGIFRINEGLYDDPGSTEQLLITTEGNPVTLLIGGNDQITIIIGQIQHLTELIENLSNVVNQHGQDINDLEQQVQTNKQDIEELQSEVESLQQKIDDIEGGGATDKFADDFTVQLSDGKSFGRFTNGDVVPAKGKTAIEVILLAAIEYINPVFTSFSITGQATTVEVGTTISGNKTFVWVIVANSGTVNLIDIYDVTAGAALLENTANDGSQVVTVTSNKLDANGATQQYRGILHDEGQAQDINSAIFTITARFYRFFGPASTSPANSAAVRALPSSAFHTGAATFTLNTGTSQTKFVVALPPGVTIASVVDLDALNANITSQYVLTGTLNVQDAGGTNRSYNIYEMNIGAPYATNHRHQITTSN